MNKVFKKDFKKADPALRVLGSEVAFLYSHSILFPEMFIRNHISQGETTYEKAEQGFMEEPIYVRKQVDKLQKEVILKAELKLKEQTI